jgi:hypothetical protein
MREAQTDASLFQNVGVNNQLIRMPPSSIQPGRYRHYKGNEYTVLDVARHSETLEELVVYRAEYGERGLWVRPAAMFQETVLVDGKSTPRFLYIGKSP